MARHRMLLAALLAGSLSALGPVVTSGAAGSAPRPVAADPPQRAVRQQATLQMHPQIAAPGRSVQSAAAARSGMTATFKPRRARRPVTLQRQKGRRWVTVARARQNRQGRVEFTAAYAGGARYRVLASRYRGLKAVRSARVSTSAPGAADFTDDFKHDALDATRWATREQDYRPDSMRRCSRSSSDATTVGGGVARLSVLNDPARGATNATDVLNGTEKCRYDGADYEWRLNGHIGTQDTFAMKYGYAAARIKFQRFRGQHGAFWMMPASRTATEGSAAQTGAEIDVIEWFGPRKNGGLASFVHHWPNDRDESVKVGDYLDNPDRFGSDWASKYHVFSVEWTPSRYVFRIDGKETYRTSQGVSGQPEFLILSMLSSDYELRHLGGEGRLPQSMSVDWVRAWQR